MTDLRIAALRSLASCAASCPFDWQVRPPNCPEAEWLKAIGELWEDGLVQLLDDDRKPTAGEAKRLFLTRAGRLALRNPIILEALSCRP